MKLALAALALLMVGAVPRSRDPACLSGVVDADEMRAAIHLAAAETNLDLCEQEAKVTDQDPGPLCLRRAAELVEAKSELALCHCLESNACPRP